MATPRSFSSCEHRARAAPFILTRGGLRRQSGIPDWRDSDGNWKRTRPVTIQAFLGSEPAPSNSNREIPSVIRLTNSWQNATARLDARVFPEGA
ncbi:hypothetical protein [Bradyrhizobium sp. USDA 4454]